MSLANKEFRILIVGGGVAGLALANMLEKFDIDYLILEAHEDIAPAVGASIGMFPNGLRILDQIDCYEPLRGFMDHSKVTSYTNDPSGRPVVVQPAFQEHVEKRHGYPLMFFDRQWLLQILYGRLQNKNNVLLNQRVAQIHLRSTGVEIAAQSGQQFSGSLVIGADGLHSVVRREMYRIGHELQPGYFPEDEQEQVPCYYLCSFGIAQNVAGWVHGDQCNVLGNGHSQLVLSGPEDRVYWFFFSRLPETKYGSDIPKCTRKMEQQFVDRYGQTPITQKVTFGDVYAKRLSSTLTPLHEYVCKTWFFDRMMVLGDSAHKPNPIGGQGGNGAIESVAEFVNALLKKKNDHSGSLNGLNHHDITEIFAETQAARHQRADRIVFASHLHQSLMAYEKPPISNLVWRFLVPIQGSEGALSTFALALLRSTRLKSIPLKNRPRAIPYNDELPAPPLTRVRLVQAFFFGLMSCLLCVAFGVLRFPNPGIASWNLGTTSSLDSIDGDHLVAFNVLRVSSQLVSPILIYTIEGHRIGNSGTPLAFPILFLSAMTLRGVGKVAIVHATLSAFMSYDFPTGRFVPPELVCSLLGALVLSHLLPLGLFISPLSLTTETGEGQAKMLGFTPPLVCFIGNSLTYISQSWKRREMAQADKDDVEFDRYRGHDVPVLKAAYALAFVVQAAAHVATILNAHWQQSNSVTGMSLVLVAIDVLMQSDMAVSVAAWFSSNLYTVWNLRRLGYIKTRGGLAPALGVIFGQILVGPGATWAGLWYWREGVLESLRKK